MQTLTYHLLVAKTKERYSNTRFKLIECTYFLQKLKESRDEDYAFLFNLSAVLAATISIEDVMLHEFNKPVNAGFKIWFDEKFANLKKIDGFEELIKYRIDITHFAGN